MSKEGFNLFPISPQAIEQAFPQGTNRTFLRESLVKESHLIQTHNKELHNVLSINELYMNNNDSTPMNYVIFRDGALFMRRMLRHQSELPVLSKDMLDVYMLDTRRDKQDQQKNIKQYFAEQWATYFGNKEEYAPVTEKLHALTKQWTSGSEEIVGGAYYMGRAYQRQIEIFSLHRKFPEVWPESQS